jgi:HAD superfamily hydrolase (TIGR01509 family)
MVQAIIFDCFGVLVRDGWIPFREQHFRHDPQQMQEAIESNRRVDAGLDTYEEFIHHVAQMAGISDAQARAEIETNPPNTELLSEIETALKPRYKIGMLSNAAEDWLDELFTARQVALFDQTVLSYQIGAIKPNPVAYQAIADRLGVAVEACLLIDDQLHYCDGARAIGMQAIQYVDNIQLANELKNYNISLAKT